ncbi:MAG: alpha/beta fold hydrolase [Pirellulales bacterium]|nr:alpha/beta fold hydrolase [Pirellulales bacterium]
MELQLSTHAPALRSTAPFPASEQHLRSLLTQFSGQFPPFQPSRMLRGGHLQTLAGVYYPSWTLPYRAQRHLVQLCDGDQLVLHDDCPPNWRVGDRTAMLIHGLSGSYQSSYMIRTAGRLNERGIRVFRLDLRGCGAGVGLARHPYHSGRSDDAIAAIEQAAALSSGSPLTLIGFSLGGNVSLKLAGEVGSTTCGGLDSVLAVCPPINLARCSRSLMSWPKLYYDRYFAKLLRAEIARLYASREDAMRINAARLPRRIQDFDEYYTAPMSGFESAEDYYTQCSAARFLSSIRKPTLIIAAADDPLIPVEIFADAQLSSSIDLRIYAGAGHMGFVARRGVDPDRRWLDWRIVDWVCAWDRASRQLPSLCGPHWPAELTRLS